MKKRDLANYPLDLIKPRGHNSPYVTESLAQTSSVQHTGPESHIRTISSHIRLIMWNYTSSAVPSAAMLFSNEEGADGLPSTTKKFLTTSEWLSFIKVWHV